MKRAPKISASLDSSSYTGSMEERSKTFVVIKSDILNIDDDGDDDDIGDDDEAAGLDPMLDVDMTRVVLMVNKKFDVKEKQIKKEMREEFQTKMTKEKRKQDTVLNFLKHDLETLSTVTTECEELRAVQKTLRRELNEQHDQISSLSVENIQLQSNCSKMEELYEENKTLKIENERLKHENVRLEQDMIRLSTSINNKEKEIQSLKVTVDSQYRKLKLEMSNTRDKFNNEQGTIHADMRKQQVMLTEISAVVKTISHDMLEDSNKANVAAGQNKKKDKLKSGVKNKAPFVAGKATPNTSFNKQLAPQTHQTRK